MKKNRKRILDKTAYIKCVVANKIFLFGVILLVISILGPFVGMYIFIIKKICFIPYYVFLILGLTAVATFALLLFHLTSNCKETYKDYKITYFKLLKNIPVYNNRIDQVCRAYCEQTGIDLAIKEYKKSHPG